MGMGAGAGEADGILVSCPPALRVLERPRCFSVAFAAVLAGLGTVTGKDRDSDSSDCCFLALEASCSKSKPPSKSPVAEVLEL